MIEILHFGLSTNRGGIETYLLKIWNNIDHKKFHFNFLDMTGEEKLPCFYDELSQSGCDFYKITPRRISIKKNRKELEELFKQHRFDILHFHANTLSYVTPIFIALKYKCKVIVHSRSAGMSQSLITNIAHYINKKRLKNKKIIRLGVSKFAAKWLFGNEKNVEIYNNGIEIEKFKYSNEKRKKIRKKLKSNEKYVIGNVGAFLPVKNHKFIIDIFEKFLKYNNNSILWLVGDGPTKNIYQKYVQEKGLIGKVLFLGTRSDVADIYAGMDLFLFPSKFEGFPNVLLEAQCEGLPCLISNCITNEVIISKNVFSLDLDIPLFYWIKKIIKISKNKNNERQKSWILIKNAGFSIEREIKNIEELYIKSLL